MNKIELTTKDFEAFRDWINLNLDSITWQGKNAEQFEKFWSEFFLPSMSLKDTIEKIRYVKNHLSTGPLITWFQWLEEKMICFVFINNNITVREISRRTVISENEISLYLRNYWVGQFPHLNDEISDLFLSGNVSGHASYVNVDKVLAIGDIKRPEKGVTDKDIMNSLEITLFSEWETLLKGLENRYLKKGLSLDKIKKKVKYRRYVTFLQELAILLFLGTLVVFTLRYGNKFYEDYLSKKVSIFEPDFFWLDRDKVFKDEGIKKKVNVDFNENDWKKLDNNDVFESVINDPDARFETDSEVEITSLSKDKKSFTDALTEESVYEEDTKGGYRDQRWGRRKAYRVLINSADAEQVKDKILNMIKEYNAEQVDRVKPGTEIPGGVYFNLHVDRLKMEDFLKNVNAFEDSIIYESKTRRPMPEGKNRVFIWVKRI